MRAPSPPFGASPPASAVACSHAEVDQDSKVSAVVDIARHLLAAHGKTELLSGSQVPPPLPGECATQMRPVCLCRLRLTPYARFSHTTDVDGLLFGAQRAPSPSRYETAPQSQPGSTAGDDDLVPAEAAPRPKPAPATTFCRAGKAGGAAAAGRSTKGKASGRGSRGGARQAAPAAEEEDEEEPEDVAPVRRGRGEPDVDVGLLDEEPPLGGALDLGPMFDVAGGDDMEEDAHHGALPAAPSPLPVAEQAVAGVASSRRKRGKEAPGGGGAPEAALRTPAPPRGTAPISSATPGTVATPGGALLAGGAPSGRVKREAAADWACVKCTLLNPVTRSNCLVCNAKKGPNKAGVADAAPAEAVPEPAAAVALMSPPPAVAIRRANTELKRRRAGAAASAPLVPSTEKSSGKRARRGGREAGDADGGDDGVAPPAAEAGAPKGGVTPAPPRGSAEDGPAPGVWASKQPWVLTSSSLEEANKEALKQLAHVAGCTYSKQWSSDVTHVVALVDDQRRAPRTVKLMCGVLTGTWVVTPSWVAACLAAGAPVDETAYEVVGMTVDGQPLGPSGMPAAQRARCLAGEPPLLAGLRIHLSGDFGLTGTALPKAALEQLIGLGGGRLLRHAPNPPDPGKAADPSVRILCDSSQRATAACQRAAEAAAVSTGCDVLSSSWLLDCVAHGQLLPTESYVYVKAA